MNEWGKNRERSCKHWRLNNNKCWLLKKDKKRSSGDTHSPHCTLSLIYRYTHTPNPSAASHFVVVVGLGGTARRVFASSSSIVYAHTRNVVQPDVISSFVIHFMQFFSFFKLSV
jgi:hypothetical protein